MAVSVLALSSRFDGLVGKLEHLPRGQVSVLALSSRFDGLRQRVALGEFVNGFSTRSVESF